MPADRLLITGANGFLGQEIFRQLQDKYTVFGCGRSVVENLGCNYVSADLLADDLRRLLPNDIDTILHVAGTTSRHGVTSHQNLAMTQRIVDWGTSVGIRNLILISSAAVYAPSEAPRGESFPCHPKSAYGRDKYSSERYAVDAASQNAFRLVVLRKPAVIGMTRQGNVSRLIRALDKKRFVQFGEGNNKKSLIQVEDAARACNAALTFLGHSSFDRCHYVFNVNGSDISMRDIVGTICEELGRDRPMQVPKNTILLLLKFLSKVTFEAAKVANRINDVEQFMRNDLLDGSLFQETVGFEPTGDIKGALKTMVRFQFQRCRSPG